MGRGMKVELFSFTWAWHESRDIFIHMGQGMNPEDLSLNPREGMDVCKCVVPLWNCGNLNIHPAASPLVRLTEGKDRSEAPDQPRVFFLIIGVSDQVTSTTPELAQPLLSTTPTGGHLSSRQILRASLLYKVCLRWYYIIGVKQSLNVLSHGAQRYGKRQPCIHPFATMNSVGLDLTPLDRW
ncbi:hypothetical protein TNCV_2834921 [Trichonephila clavipes]|nr:hypothetical protein TNCV_2834921 [Trichonephila clavipes]